MVTNNAATNGFFHVSGGGQTGINPSPENLEKFLTGMMRWRVLFWLLSL